VIGEEREGVGTGKHLLRKKGVKVRKKRRKKEVLYERTLYHLEKENLSAEGRRGEVESSEKRNLSIPGEEKKKKEKGEEVPSGSFPEK